MIQAKQRYDDSHGIEVDDEPKVMSLFDMRAKTDIAGDQQRVARVEWLAFKRYTTTGRY
jgi:hypothetical protein